LTSTEDTVDLLVQLVSFPALGSWIDQALRELGKLLLPLLQMLVQPSDLAFS
jgi:hypothetical protein